VLADPGHELDHAGQLLAVDPAVVLDVVAERGGHLPGLDPHGEVDLLGRGEQGDLADLFEVHPDGVVRGGLEDVLVPRGRGGGVLQVVAGHLDDLDALLPEVLLDLGEELLDLLGADVLDREPLDQVLAGDEAPLPTPGHDELLGLFQDRVLDDLSHYAPSPARVRASRHRPVTSASCLNRSSKVSGSFTGLRVSRRFFMVSTSRRSLSSSRRANSRSA
jgi:hypothetical protein